MGMNFSWVPVGGHYVHKPFFSGCSLFEIIAIYLQLLQPPGKSEYMSSSDRFPVMSRGIYPILSRDPSF